MFDFLFKVVVGNEKKNINHKKAHRVCHFPFHMENCTHNGNVCNGMRFHSIKCVIIHFVGNIESKMWLLLGIFASIDDY